MEAESNLFHFMTVFWPPDLVASFLSRSVADCLIDRSGTFSFSTSSLFFHGIYQGHKFEMTGARKHCYDCLFPPGLSLNLSIFSKLRRVEMPSKLSFYRPLNSIYSAAGKSACFLHGKVERHFPIFFVPLQKKNASV